MQQIKISSRFVKLVLVAILIMGFNGLVFKEALAWGGGGGFTRTNVNSGGNFNRNASVNSTRSYNGNTNINRNVNVNNNVNVNRNVNVNNNYHGGYYGGYHGGYYGGGVSTGAAIGIGVAGLAVGAMIASSQMPPPSSCMMVPMNGMTYTQCGNTWFRPVYTGSTVSYTVVNRPY